MCNQKLKGSQFSSGDNFGILIITEHDWAPFEWEKQN